MIDDAERELKAQQNVGWLHCLVALLCLYGVPSKGQQQG